MNGVFNYDNLTFLDGNPEDMCSLSTNIKPEPLTEDDKQYMEDKKILLFYEPLGLGVGDYFLPSITQAIAGKRLKR